MYKFFEFKALNTKTLLRMVKIGNRIQIVFVNGHTNVQRFKNTTFR